MKYIVISVEEARRRLKPPAKMARFGADGHSRKYANDDCERLNTGETDVGAYSWSDPNAPSVTRGWGIVHEEDLAPDINEYGEVCP